MSDENTKKKGEELHDIDAGAESPEVLDVLEEDDAVENAEEDSVLGENAELQNQLEEARNELEKSKKDYLYLMAEFDNYRKRVTREKADLLKNAGERVLLGILPIVDDFERGLAATEKDSDAEAVRKGFELIYNKLISFLASNGVKPMESNGADFDPDLHEAIATIPAPSEDMKGKVIDTTQKGYTINDKVLRHAKVAVGE